jgi:hypothetical protein
MDELVLSISPENEHFYVRDNCLISRESSKIIAIGKNAVIPNDGSVTYLNLAIYSYLSNVTSIVVPSGIKEMEVTLNDCKALQSIIIGKDVKKTTVNSNGDNGNFAVYYQCTVYEKNKIDIQSTVVDTPILQIGSDQFSKESEHYYYSESAPTEVGNFWHYVNGVPTPW